METLPDTKNTVCTTPIQSLCVGGHPEQMHLTAKEIEILLVEWGKKTQA